jgi:hypothetical protein
MGGAFSADAGGVSGQREKFALILFLGTIRGG